MADQLTPEEQEKLVEAMKLQWLQGALTEAEESVAQGRVLTEEQLDARLDVRRRAILDKQKK